MTDHVSKSKRSEIMRAVHSKDSGPERIVRSAAHRLGFRFRLHRKTLPGSPDMVFPKYKTVVFVNGCFWHRHPGCRKTTTPKTNTSFWGEKFRRNMERDKENYEALNQLGWTVVIVWQCEVKNIEQAICVLKDRLPRLFFS